MEGASKRLVADWVARGLKKPGKSQVGLARAMGITQPQITRLLAAERSLRVEEIAVVQRYLDEPFPFGEISPSSVLDSQIIGQMPVLGRVAAGVWMEKDKPVDTEIGQIPLATDPAYPMRRQYAVQVIGDSMDLVFPDGSYAVCVEAAGLQPAYNDLVIVRRAKGGLVERTIARFVTTPEGAELRPESRNPIYGPIPAVGNGDTTVEIEALVIGRYERLRR